MQMKKQWNKKSRKENIKLKWEYDERNRRKEGIKEIIG